MEEKDIRNSLENLFSEALGKEALLIRKLAQSGSNRQYFRMYDGQSSYVGTFVQDPAEGECFISLAKSFKGAGRNVPEIIAASCDCRFYIQEDLGEVSLFSVLSSPEAPDNVRETLKRLVKLQRTHEDVWLGCCMARPFCERQAMWDLNYFKYEYLKPLEILFDEDRLDDDFSLLTSRLVSIPQEYMGFMMRDCQSRNVMLSADGPVFIDFQGGRRGPVLYDAVSMLWQARAGFDDAFRKEMLDFYCDLYCEGDADKKVEMLASLSDIVLFRTLQVLGAYGFRGLVQRKSHFLLSIPGAMSNLTQLVGVGALDDYPELKRCAMGISSKDLNSKRAKSDNLTVEIFSFSYKKGYPEDLSGNGGGFMFDCRAMHNPGRYKKYVTLTGRDREVIDFLEERGEVGDFLRNAWSLTDPAIERYIARGFTNIQIGFGCTGGQHRSVYCAEKTAAHVRDLFPEVSVSLIHREHPAQ